MLSCLLVPFVPLSSSMCPSLSRPLYLLSLPSSISVSSPTLVSSLCVLVCIAVCSLFYFDSLVTVFGAFNFPSPCVVTSDSFLLCSTRVSIPSSPFCVYIVSAFPLSLVRPSVYLLSSFTFSRSGFFHVQGFMFFASSV